MLKSKTRNRKPKGVVTIGSKELSGELRELLQHIVNAERSNRENRTMHTDNNIRAAHLIVVKMMTQLDDSPND
jgi:hypothetical protein